MLGSVHDHEKVSVVPVKDKVKAIALLYGLICREDEDRVPVIALSGIKDGIRAKVAAVAALASAFRVEDGSVGSDLGGLVGVHNGFDCACDAFSVGICVVEFVHESDSNTLPIRFKMVILTSAGDNYGTHQIGLGNRT